MWGQGVDKIHKTFYLMDLWPLPDLDSSPGRIDCQIGHRRFQMEWKNWTLEVSGCLIQMAIERGHLATRRSPIR